MGLLSDKGVLVTGGTGSLGKILVRRIVRGEWGQPAFVRVMSRDEGKQHAMRIAFSESKDEFREGLAYRAIAGKEGPLQFFVGDVRDPSAVARGLRDVDLVFNAAALKQVPSCEYHPWEAARTNVEGPQHIVQAIFERRLPVQAVIGISTDKACKPVNVMGMTKALQERLLQHANLLCPGTRFVCVRYGNVLASRASVIPLFHHQIAHGGPVTVTDARMTRFFLTLDRAVDTVFAALADAHPGETFVPRLPSARILDLAEVLAAERGVRVELTEVRPGEKIHEELISEEEASRTSAVGEHYAVASVLPEVAVARPGAERLGGPYSSADSVLAREDLRAMLERNDLMRPRDDPEELLR